ncbi:MAG TPA: 2-phosphosulfolactate phosphatase [Ignavibacteria bacterium]
MSKITIIPIPSLITEDLLLKDKIVVIVDVLRATSTMLVALANGAKEIIPAESINTAARIARGSGKSALLCGERAGKIVKGFDLGNSPFEYTKEAIENKTLVFTTTNGTVAIHKARYAEKCILASFLNLSKVVEYLDDLNRDFIVICSGKLNSFCLEDFVFAGALLSKLFKLNKNKPLYEISDTEIASKLLSKSMLLVPSNPSKEKVVEMFDMSEHGSYLKSLGFEKDLGFCAEIDSYPILPFVIKGVIKLQEKIEAEQITKKNLKKINYKETVEHRKHQ